MMPPIGERLWRPAEESNFRCRTGQITELILRPHHPASDRDCRTENERGKRQKCGAGLLPHGRQRFCNNRDQHDRDERQIAELC